jgi:anhydro-N-acetylmuramic acid kinase
VRVIGLISGTSFDAIEAAAADLDIEGDEMRCRLLGAASRLYPRPLRERIAAALSPAKVLLDEVCRLDTEIGQAFGELAAAVDRSICEGRTDLVCSHGQTVYHWVEDGAARGTLQLGQPAWIAERTGLPVVSDVRARDVAAGGQGAPLVSLLDALLLEDGSGPARAALNLGGIANVTVVRPGRDPVAYDTGPANALLDAVAADRTNGRLPCDQDGLLAASGSLDRPLLERLLEEPYYRLPPPKSTGKELFNLAYVTRALEGRAVGTEDLLATLTALTVETVAAELERQGVAEVYASGGGTRNPTLMRRLAVRLSGVRLRRADDLGVPESAKEALAFALIGFLSASGLTATLPSCTGARHPVILGSLTPGAGPLRLPPPAAVSPRRLVMLGR